jgi:UDP-glucose:(heptosyl)LPS alpha-1,3-glucosyltransferase
VRAPEAAVVSPEASRRGGVERVAWDLLAHLAQRHEVAFVGESAPIGLPAGVQFARIDSPTRVPSFATPIVFRRAAARALRSLRPHTTVSLGAVAPPHDVLWVQSVHRAWLRLAHRIPFHGVTVPAQVRYLMPRHAVLLALERSYFKHSTPRAIICTSQREIDDLVEIYDIDPKVATVVPNPFDPALFNPTRRASLREEVRREMGVSEGEIAIYFVANELHRKGFEETIKALARIRDDRLTLHVIGRKEPSAYRAMIARLGLQVRVCYHGATDDVGRLFAGADLLVLPTQYEPFGLVIVEALASAVPVVTTRLAGASAAIQHGVNGLLQDDPYDVEELADLIRQAGDADLESWSEAAARSVDAYRRDVVMSRVEEILFGV